MLRACPRKSSFLKKWLEAHATGPQLSWGTESVFPYRGGWPGHHRSQVRPSPSGGRWKVASCSAPEHSGDLEIPALSVQSLHYCPKTADKKALPVSASGSSKVLKFLGLLMQRRPRSGLARRSAPRAQQQTPRTDCAVTFPFEIPYFPLKKSPSVSRVPVPADRPAHIPRTPFFPPLCLLSLLPPGEGAASSLVLLNSTGLQGGLPSDNSLLLPRFLPQQVRNPGH